MAFWKTVVVIEVLSEDDTPPDFRAADGLEAMVYRITDGDCSGAIKDHLSTEVSQEEMRRLLVAQGSDEDFLGNGLEVDVDDRSDE